MSLSCAFDVSLVSVESLTVSSGTCKRCAVFDEFFVLALAHSGGEYTRFSINVTLWDGSSRTVSSSIFVAFVFYRRVGGIRRYCQLVEITKMAMN